jgi:hypothetical protein
LHNKLCGVVCCGAARAGIDRWVAMGNARLRFTLDDITVALGPWNVLGSVVQGATRTRPAIAEQIRDGRSRFFQPFDPKTTLSPVFFRNPAMISPSDTPYRSALLGPILPVPFERDAS